MSLNKYEWLARCAAQYKKRAELEQKDCAYLANVALDEDKDGDFTDDPEGAADADMECWDDDA